MDIFSLQNFFQHLQARVYTRLAMRSFASFGRSSHMFYPCRINRPHMIHIGSKTVLFPDVWLNPVGEWGGETYQGEIHIGDDCHILNNVQITSASCVRIGNKVSIGRNCVVADHVHDYRDMTQPIQDAPLGNIKPVTIGDESMVNVNCVVTPGAAIGRHCFIGSNSLVRSDIPDYSLAVGSPAKVIMRYDPATGQWKKNGDFNDEPANL
ncbi:MAG: acyltransferase [Acidobacteriota bacterium]